MFFVCLSVVVSKTSQLYKQHSDLLEAITAYPSRAHMLLMSYILLSFLVFCVVLCLCALFLSSSCVLCAQCFPWLWFVRYWLALPRCFNRLAIYVILGIYFCMLGIYTTLGEKNNKMLGVACHNARGFQVTTYFIIQSYFKIKHSRPGYISVEKRSYNFNHLLCTVAIK